MVTIIGHPQIKSKHIVMPEAKLIIQSLHGTININTLHALQRLDLREVKKTESYNIVTDIRAANLVLNATEIIRFAACEKAIRSRKPLHKTAIFASSPKQIALSYFLLKQMNISDINGDVFSTYEGLIDWLNIIPNSNITSILNGNNNLLE